MRTAGQGAGAPVRRSRSCGATVEACKLPSIVGHLPGADNFARSSASSGKPRAASVGPGLGKRHEKDARGSFAKGSPVADVSLPPIASGCHSAAPVARSGSCHRRSGRSAASPATRQGVSTEGYVEVTAAKQPRQSDISEYTALPVKKHAAPRVVVDDASRDSQNERPSSVDRPPSAKETTRSKPRGGASEVSARDGNSVSRPAKEDSAGLRGYVSDDLRKVLEEETVTYSWRRKETRPAAALPAETHTSAQVDSVSTAGQASACNPANGCTTTAPKAAVNASRPSSNASQSSRIAVGRPPRPQINSSKNVASRALVPVTSVKSVPAGPKKSGPANMSVAPVLDLEEASRARETRIRDAATSAADPGISVKVVAYDGSTPSLKRSCLPDACCAAISMWLHGEMSGEFVLLHIDDWSQGEILWPEEMPSLLQSRLGLVAGMLGDASLHRPALEQLNHSVFAAQPHEELTAAVQEVLSQAANDGSSILVSEVEHALALLESGALGSGAVARIRCAVRRQLLRQAWTQELPQANWESQFGGDTWLIGELQKTPAAVAEVAQGTSREQLIRENQRLDQYLIRLIKLKRALSALVDTWEKVNHYDALGVSPDCSDKELKSAYRKACLRLHPDKGGDKQLFQQLQDSYAKILEERASAKARPANVTTKERPSHEPPNASTSKHPAESPASERLALEGIANEPSNVAGEVPSAAAEVASAELVLRDLAEQVASKATEANRAEAKLIELARSKDGGVEALRIAQDAGDLLMRLAQELGEVGPRLSECTMEVAEASLELAARFSSVPAALLLTDVALSCTFEASRMTHAAKQLLDVRSDTITTLQTLQSNLDMARIIGKVDAEMFKLSLGLVTKAAKRIIVLLRGFAAAVADGAKRGHQCSAHAKSVAAFAEGRASVDAAAAAEDAAFNHPALGDANRDSACGSPKNCQTPAPEANNSPQPAAASRTDAPVAADTGPQRVAALITARLQNDRLMRQLNKDALDLQRRARSHLAGRGASFLTEVPAEATSRAIQLSAEALCSALQAQIVKIRSGSACASVDQFEASLTDHFGFVDTCGCALAMPTDLAAQVVRIAALINAQAVLGALEGHVKLQLALEVREFFAAKCDGADVEPFLGALDRRFERLAASVVAARMAAS